MRKVLLVCVLVMSALFAQVDYSTASLYKNDINSQEAYNMQKSENTILIDVRTKAEFNEKRAKDSINIPVFFSQNGQRVYNKNFLNEIYSALNKDVNKKAILICRSGSRSKMAANLLAEQGFKNIYNIKNGFTYDWEKTNLATEK